MLRIVTINGELVKPKLVQDEDKIDPQSLLDMYCVLCFRHRSQYLINISDKEPFNLDRARIIMNIMLDHKLIDLKAGSLGNDIKRNWYKFKDLAQ